METWVKVLVIAAVVFSLIFCSFYIFLTVSGRAIVTKQIEDITHQKVAIGHFEVSPALTVFINDLEITGVGKVESLIISPQPLGILTGAYVCKEVVIAGPHLVLVRNNNQLSTVSEGQGEAASVPMAVYVRTAAQKRKYFYRVASLRRITLRNGELDFIDRGVGGHDLKISLKDLNLSCAVSPHFLSRFTVTGRIPWREGKNEGRLSAKGWINPFTRDMRATAEIINIDGVYLAPYYKQWLDLEKTGVEKATLHFTSALSGFHNDLTANCRLELADIAFKQLAPEEKPPKEEKAASQVIDMFKALEQGRVSLNFTVKTKMDRPEFGFSGIRMALEEKFAQGRIEKALEVQDVLSVPNRALEGIFKSASELTHAIASGTSALGTLVGKTRGDGVKKEKP